MRCFDDVQLHRASTILVAPTTCLVAAVCTIATGKKRERHLAKRFRELCRGRRYPLRIRDAAARNHCWTDTLGRSGSLAGDNATRLSHSVTHDEMLLPDAVATTARFYWSGRPDSPRRSQRPGQVPGCQRLHISQPLSNAEASEQLSGIQPGFTLPFFRPLLTPKPGLGRPTAASVGSSIGSVFIASNSQFGASAQTAAMDGKMAVFLLLTGGLQVRVLPEEPILSMS